MKVKDIINTQIKTENNVKFIVTPKNQLAYHNGENDIPDEVAEMEIESWFICNRIKNQCDFIIIVKRNKEYESKIEKKVLERLKEYISK